ncbi:MAG: lycopene cyclase domain-containing protein [Candidatus Omnitrophica bacterium]|nr:lycopene cyclase domain-containing protein [Candidatus Omnitrophota bacterium]
MYTYLLINFFTVLIPLALSFEPRVRYWKKWRYLFPALGTVGAVFIVWDAYFVQRGVWGFTPSYLLGVRFFKLPLEELLFFVCIPFSCVFIYEVIRYFDKKSFWARPFRPLCGAGAAAAFVLAVFNPGKIYTLVTFLCLSGVLFYRWRHPRNYMGRFFFMYLISLIPFFAVNGLLTGGIAVIDSRPVVWYSGAENLGIRIGTIPLEDFFYSMLLLLCNVSVYEYLRKKYQPV